MTRLMTKVYFKWNYAKEGSYAGWYYKIGKKEFGTYETERDANASLLLRIKDHSQREQYNGIITAFQAEDEGSIPFFRSE